MYKKKLKDIYAVLLREKMLKEVIIQQQWHITLPDHPIVDHVFHSLSYDSREADEATLFFCKGQQFKEVFLEQAVTGGVKVYVSEQPYDSIDAVGLIVTDIREAMAMIAQFFYDHPENKLTKIGITGTKGKTSCAYFLKDSLEQATNHKTALFSSEGTTLDGVHYTRSHLTTPEALDLYKQMAKAVENGLTHLVMEVSSQAYKTKRVFGLTFELGIFLNISPDHISPIEHPTFDDYLYCKRQLIQHSKQMILNADSDYFELLAETCTLYRVPYVTFGRSLTVDVEIQDATDTRSFDLIAHTLSFSALEGGYRLAILGTFNHDNATAALLVSHLLGFSEKISRQAIANTVIPGRMHVIDEPNQPLILIDFAHNYLSIKAVGELGHHLRPNGKVIILTGSTGGKALSRRADIAKALSEIADEAILTSDDPNFEDPAAIAKEIISHIDNDALSITVETQREKAIAIALSHATTEDIVAICGKGTEKEMKINGLGEPYPGDYEVVQQLLN